MPFFVLRGVILGHMAAFKQHCCLGFWGPEMNAILNEAGLHSEDGMGSLGKITSLKDLPSDKKMLGYYRHAAELHPHRRAHQVPRSVPQSRRSLPRRFLRSSLAALKKNKAAAKVFAAFSSLLPARIRRLDRRCQAPGDPRKTHRHGDRVDRRRQTAQLEVSELLTGFQSSAPRRVQFEAFIWRNDMSSNPVPFPTQTYLLSLCDSLGLEKPLGRFAEATGLPVKAARPE